MSLMSTLVHHGMIFVPWGYTDKNMEKLDEVHGGMNNIKSDPPSLNLFRVPLGCGNVDG